MRYSIKPRDRRYVKGYGFFSFANNIATHLSNQYSAKLLDSAKNSATDGIKTTSKRLIQTAEATVDLIDNKITDEITKKSSKESHSKELHSNETNNEIPKERYIFPKETEQIIDELRLI